EGFRTDVTVMNLSLLNTGRYIYYAAKLLPEAKRIQLSIPMEEWKSSKNNFRRYNGEVVVFPKNDVTFEPLPNEVRMDQIEIKGRGIQYDYQYLLKQDLAVIDILKTNAWKRPIYFTNTIAQSDYIGLEVGFRVEGMAYRVTPFRSEASSEDPYKVGHMDANRTYDLMLNEFSYDGIIGAYDKITRMYEMAGSLSAIYNRLAIGLMESGDTAKVPAVLRKYLEIFPPGKIKPGFMDGQLCLYAHLAGEPELGARFSESVMQFLKTELPTYYEKTKRDRLLLDLHLQTLRNVFDVIDAPDKKAELEEIVNPPGTILRR
ncbi:MAG: hypothetical protein AAF570_17940, partial [Bacteroidota bacterium]